MDNLNKINNKEIDIYSKINEPNVHFLCKGYNVLKEKFFIYYEDFFYIRGIKKFFYFKNFDEYWSFVNCFHDKLGDMYHRAFYYGYDFSDEIIHKYRINMKKIETFPRLQYNISLFMKLGYTEDEIFKYDCAEQLKRKYYDKFVDKIIKFENISEVNKIMKKIDKLYHNGSIELDVECFMDIFLSLNKNIEKILEEYCTNPNKYKYIFLNVKEAYLRFSNNEKLLKILKKLPISKKDLDILNDENQHFNIEYGFDLKSHLYYKEIEKAFTSTRIYYRNLEELHLDNNETLNIKNLFYDMNLKENISEWISQECPLPPHYYHHIRSEIIKKYDDIHDKFIVIINYYDEDIFIFSRKFEFNFIASFIAFLNYDLSHADLIYCDNLDKIPHNVKLNLTDAKMQSKYLEVFGMHYQTVQKQKLTPLKINIEANNDESSIILREEEDRNEDEIYIQYISDLHLEFKLQDCMTQEDILYKIHKMCYQIISECYAKFLLINGDVCHDFELYTLFVKELKKIMYDMKKRIHFIFTLGNHELWEFPSMSLDEIISKYKLLLSQYDMYLLHDNILYYDNLQMKEISPLELDMYNEEEARKYLNGKSPIFFGGIGFSGKSSQFNAYNGLYRLTISREEEIKLSEDFDNRYQKIVRIMRDMKPIILTHMPIECWSDEKYIPNFIYVSGHTHRNSFSDDGNIRIYADNQIGYSETISSVHLASLLLNTTYDTFIDYKDGVYNITSEQYKNFLRGKNVRCNYNRTPYKLYMLKRQGYYCFISESKNHQLCILHGGALKKLEQKDINYYYSHMLEAIDLIYELEPYYHIQKNVSKEIKAIGGSGYIHGCIVDIDFYNHIYINPFDLTCTPYFAWNIYDKMLYPSLSKLLEERNETLFLNYKQGTKQLPSLNNLKYPAIQEKTMYYDRDIYQYSRYLNKTQRIQKGILSIWPDKNNTDNNLLTNQ